MLANFANLVLLVLLVALGGAAIIWWTRDLATLLWQFATRTAFVGSVTLVVFLIVTAGIAVLVGVAPRSSLPVALALIVTPLIASRLSDYLAWKTDRADDRENLEKSAYIFARRRAAQATAYEAPPIDP
jgi:hypothetical protein